MLPKLTNLFSALPLITRNTSAESLGIPFNVTAIATVNNSSRLECWTLLSIPKSGAGAVSYDIGNFEGGFVGILPARTYKENTITHAPAVQFTIALSGLIHIRTPYSGLADHLNEAWIQGGKYGFVIAADTKASGSIKGHVTEFPSDEPTWLAQFPTLGNAIPQHVVLHEGPCGQVDLINL
ncbi:hypothetical protein P154DRAFT_494095 [Amniculicola lignicola CBS 123094]|uniref:Small secreted protein n=1 Tax=Amniculicola lignicola CBS 123094 TaxID=1392246 RepID=A0A6A5WCC2_9PLEO|nr:hypothetical protein P154DRAFT_494095 [Amniculicola lignicola CBS 123094]